MDVDPSSPFPESGDDVNAARSNSPTMETDDASAAEASLPNVLAPRNPNSGENPLTSAQIQVGFDYWLFDIFVLTKFHFNKTISLAG